MSTFGKIKLASVVLFSAVLVLVLIVSPIDAYAQDLTYSVFFGDPYGIGVSETYAIVHGTSVKDVVIPEYINGVVVRLVQLDNMGLTSIDVSQCSKLLSLSFSGNYIKSIDLKCNPELRALFCSLNDLRQLDLSNNKRLLSLSCSENRIASLNLTMLPNLFSVYVAGNRLFSLDVRSNMNLLDLSCESNGIGQIDTSNNPLLRMLSCSNNNITSLNLANNQELQILNCGNNLISSLDLSNNKKLISVDCSNNLVSELHEINQVVKYAGINCGILDQKTGIDLSSLISIDDEVIVADEPTVFSVRTGPFDYAVGEFDGQVTIVPSYYRVYPAADRQYPLTLIAEQGKKCWKASHTFSRGDSHLGIVFELVSWDTTSNSWNRQGWITANKQLEVKQKLNVYVTTGNDYYILQLRPGTTIGNLQTPTREGYTFAGWWLAEGSGKLVGSDYTFESDTRICAIWKCSKAEILQVKITGAKLNAPFKPNKLNYLIRLSKQKKQIVVAVRRISDGAQIHFRLAKTWEKRYYQAVTVASGKSKTVSVRVTSEDGSTTRAYSFKVTRKK